MLDRLASLVTAAPWWELALIFFVKITEVSVGTVRHLLVNRGYRRPGALLSFFEVGLWVFVASQVINGISDAPSKGIVYSLGYAVGVYLGSKLENQLAYGSIMVQAVVSWERGTGTIDALRKRGFGVTSMRAEGTESPRNVLLVLASRRRRSEIIQCILNVDPQAMITANNATHLYGGQLGSWKWLTK